MERVSLVTGATGFIGKSLCSILSARGESWVGTVSPRSSVSEEYLIRCNLADLGQVSELIKRFQPIRIFNLAAVGVTNIRSVQSSEFANVNVRLPGFLFENMPVDCRLVHAGSMSEYRSSETPLREDDSERSFATLYHWSKNAANDLLDLLSRDRPERFCIRARLFGVMGPNEASTRLVPAIVDACMNDRPVQLSTGEQIRDVVHVNDASSALRHLADAESLKGRAVNVGRGQGRSVRWIATRVAQIFDKEPLLRFGERARHPGEAMQLVADISRLKASGWSPSLTLEQTIDNTVEVLKTKFPGAH